MSDKQPQPCRMRDGATTDDYRRAMDGVGGFFSLGYEWKDKPHRIVYDLCGEVDTLRDELARVRVERNCMFDMVKDLESKLAAAVAERDEAVKALRPVVREAREKEGDFDHPSWNHDAHVELTLTIKEIRRAAALVARLDTTHDAKASQ